MKLHIHPPIAKLRKAYQLKLKAEALARAFVVMAGRAGISRECYGIKGDPYSRIRAPKFR